MERWKLYPQNRKTTGSANVGGFYAKNEPLNVENVAFATAVLFGLCLKYPKVVIHFEVNGGKNHNGIRRELSNKAETLA